MSALAKPGLNTPNSDAVLSSAVNLDHVMSVDTADLPAYATSENNTPRFVIIWKMLSSDNQDNTITWVYSESATAEADRDTDFTAASAAFAATLP